MPLPGSTLPPRDAFQRLIEGLQTFIREHLALVRSEAKDEIKALGRDAALAAACLPFLATGYLLLMVAAGFGLVALGLAAWGAFLIVAAVNLAAGTALTVVLGRRVRGARVTLARTGEELERDKQWVAQLKGAVARPAMPAAAPATVATTEVKHG